MFDAHIKLREIFARRRRDVPWTPLQAFEIIGGPTFLEFLPDRAPRQTHQPTPGE